MNGHDGLSLVCWGAANVAHREEIGICCLMMKGAELKILVNENLPGLPVQTVLEGTLHVF